MRVRKDNHKIQGNYKGVNKLCEQCTKECKQFENVKVVVCPNFTSAQSQTLE